MGIPKLKLIIFFFLTQSLTSAQWSDNQSLHSFPLSFQQYNTLFSIFLVPIFYFLLEFFCHLAALHLSKIFLSQITTLSILKHVLLTNSFVYFMI